MIDRLFLEYSSRQLRKDLAKIETCVARLTPEQVWARGHAPENAIGNLLLHLAGNVRQRLICAVQDLPDTRERDAEFNAISGANPNDLLARLRATVEEALIALGGVSADRLTQIVRVQNHDITVLDTIYHVVEHFAYHTGQVVFATKNLTGQDAGFTSHNRASVSKV